MELVNDVEWDACEKAMGDLPGGVCCDGQCLEGGLPLRYRDLPAVSRDGQWIAVIEERDGWGHVRPGIRVLDRRGRSKTWLPLHGTGATARKRVESANRALARRTWVALAAPAPSHRELSDELVETTLTLTGATVVYRRRSDGNVWLPPSSIRVTGADGHAIVERTDTERAWSAPPRCNLPRFELVGASASAGIVLFATRLGLGGHDCDGVLQPPSWHVLSFDVKPPR